MTLKRKLAHLIIDAKTKILESHGSTSSFNMPVEQLEESWGVHLDRLARMVEGWGLPPETVVEAIFTWAVKKLRHPQGPMPTQVGSYKYASAAVSDYLQLRRPLHGVVLMIVMARIDDRWNAFLASVSKSGDPVGITGAPVSFRWLAAKLLGADFNEVGQELLADMERDSITRLWLEQRGVTYETVADDYNDSPYADDALKVAAYKP